ncbi:hypothetical protein PM082_006168 [Marasmius tenuissimus]|nr:hypothetical protein PM082_006168 [Marasmius tenuissimus]
MSHQHSPFYSTKDGWCINRSKLPEDVYSMSWRDHNVNTGPGTLTINNDNRVFQQPRSTSVHLGNRRGGRIRRVSA